MKRLALLLSALALAGCGVKSNEATMLEAGCSLQSRALTGHTIYCGKACYRPEVKTVWSCPAHTRVFYE